MCQGLGLNKHDLAVRLSGATGSSYENVLMDLNKVSSGTLWADRSTISEKAFGKFARSQGVSDWDAAGLVSDMTGMNIEAAHSKMNAVDVRSVASGVPGTFNGLMLDLPRRHTDKMSSARSKSVGPGSQGFSTHLAAVGGTSITNGPACACGNRGWLLRDSYVKCSQCGRTREVKIRAYVTDGPECCCGSRDWLIGQNGARCTNCDRYREAKVRGYVTDGPECCCGSHGWFIGEQGARCASCDRYREATVRGIVVNGPQCCCGSRGWFIGRDGVRCASCDRWREVNFHGTIVGGPECSCGGSDWFVGETGHRCANCDRWR